MLPFYIVGLCLSAIVSVGSAADIRRLVRQSDKPEKRVNKTFYIIPKSSVSCLPPFVDETIYIDPDKFVLRNDRDKSIVLEFPGCVEIEAEVQLLKPLPTNLFAYAEWQWLQAPPNANVSNLRCTNVSDNGCGGVGNRCFYCDACNQLQSIQQDAEVNPDDQFKCPATAGIFTYKDKVCMNDWGELDKDGDGDPDFLHDTTFQEYKRLLDLWSYKGYGTMLLRFLLASNASVQQQREINLENQYWKSVINSMSDQTFNSLQQRLASQGSIGWRPKDLSGTPQQQLQKLKDAYSVYRNNVSYASQWLPRFLRENLMACVEVSFDICDGRPSPHRFASSVSGVCS